MRAILQHWLNPAHIMCRLIDMGMSRMNALRYAAMYERLYRRVL